MRDYSIVIYLCQAFFEKKFKFSIYNIQSSVFLVFSLVFSLILEREEQKFFRNTVVDMLFHYI